MRRTGFMTGDDDGVHSLSSCYESVICSGGSRRQPTQRQQPQQPQQIVDADAMMALVASELNQLSAKERQTVLEDVHGVSQNMSQESPEAIHALLGQLHHEISKRRYKTFYDKAVFLCPQYVHHPKFLLMFLRSENYNVKLAANRLDLHFKHKLELFGIEKLAKRITLDDLDEDDKAALFSGSLHILRQKDRSGRTVFFSIQERMLYKHAYNQIRASWYLLMATLEDDDDAQRNGFVFVRYSIGVQHPTTKHMNYLMKAASLLTPAIPLQAKGFHFCYDDEHLWLVYSVYQKFFGNPMRMRLRTHFGSPAECIYELMGYGIVKEALPIDLNGNLQLAGLAQSNEERRLREEEETLEGGNEHIPFPLEPDVLLGRGRPYQEFPGNLHMAQLIHDHQQVYTSETKFQKTIITNKIVHLIQLAGGRFLKKNDQDVWVQVTQDVARGKVSNGFRTNKMKRIMKMNSAINTAVDTHRDSDGTTSLSNKKPPPS